jgi:hypothetical protein
MKRCPDCSRVSPNEIWACQCGFEFTGNEPIFDPDPAETAAGKRPMSVGAKIGCVLLTIFGVCLLVLAIMFAQCAASLSHI